MNGGDICEGTDSKLTRNSTAVHEKLMRVVHENSVSLLINSLSVSVQHNYEPLQHHE